MVATSNIAGVRYRQSSDAPSLHGATSDMAVDLDPRVVAYFATTGARDTAYTAAIAGTTPYTTPQKGMRCYVQAGSGGGFPDWCGWNGTEWIWDNPVPVTYYSGSIAGTSVNYTTPSGHSPSVYSFTPSRSGYARVRVNVQASSGVSGYNGGYLRPRYSSGTLLPGGTGFTVIENLPAGQRKDGDWDYPVPIYLTKNVSTSLAFDLWSNTIGGSAYWALASAQWQIVQI